MSMVERVARALIRARGAVIVADEEWPETAAHHYRMCAKYPDTYPQGGSLITDAFRDARAAIEAMREPTDEMVKVGVDIALNVSLGGDMKWPRYIADKHRAMIAAALSPPPRITPSRKDGRDAIHDDL